MTPSPSHWSAARGNGDNTTRAVFGSLFRLIGSTSRLLRVALVLALGVMALGSRPALAQSPTKYDIVGLDILPGDSSMSATGINDKGQVVGYTVNSSGRFRAVSWQNGTITDLGTLPGGTGARAFGINNNGQVVGYSKNALGQERAVLWQDGTITDLGTPPGGGGEAWANGINDNGQVVGYYRSEVYDPNYRALLTAFLWQNGSIVSLGTLPGGSYSLANGINDNGQVVGWSENASGNNRAVMWQNGSIASLGTLPGGDHSYGYDITNHSVLVGYSDNTSGQMRAFEQKKGVMSDVGAVRGADSDFGAYMNDHEMGVSNGLNASNQQSAFVWQGDWKADLNDLIDPALGWRILYAKGINNSGWIVGYGTMTGVSGYRAFLLKPRFKVLTALAITNFAPSLFAPGDTLELKVLGTFADDSTENYTYKCQYFTDYASVAVCSNDGVINARGPGTVKVYAQNGGITSPALTLTVAAPTSLSITPASNQTIGRADAVQFAVTGTFSDSSTRDLTSFANFTISDTSVLQQACGPVPGLIKSYDTDFKAGAPNVSASLGSVATPAIKVTASATLAAGGAVRATYDFQASLGSNWATVVDGGTWQRLDLGSGAWVCTVTNASSTNSILMDNSAAQSREEISAKIIFPSDTGPIARASLLGRYSASTNGTNPRQFDKFYSLDIEFRNGYRQVALRFYNGSAGWSTLASAPYDWGVGLTYCVRFLLDRGTLRAFVAENSFDDPTNRIELIATGATLVSGRFALSCEGTRAYFDDIIRRAPYYPDVN